MPRARRTPAQSTMVTEELVKTCPACGLNIMARVTIEVTMGEPEIDDQGGVTVPHTSKMTRYAVSHACPGMDEPGAEAPNPPESTEPPKGTK